jgi:hypothetical protein
MEFAYYNMYSLTSKIFKINIKKSLNNNFIVNKKEEIGMLILKDCLVEIDNFCSEEYDTDTSDE